MKKQSFFLLMCLLSGVVHSQHRAASSAATNIPVIPIQQEQWAGSPVLHTLDPKYNTESAVILLDKRRIEYADEKGELVAYKTLHKIIRVNDDRGIESFNRVYLGVSDNSDIIDIKARTILPGGKVIEIDKGNIKDLKEEDGNLYKIFAMEGLEKGCEVEYYYTFKRDAAYFGGELIQGSFPILNARLDILAPERLIFEMKGYNCTASPKDTILNGQRIVSAEQKDIPGVEDEKYAAYKMNLQRLEYKLCYNNAIDKGARMLTWNELAKRVYNNYTSWSEKEGKAAADLVSANKWDQAGSETEKIVGVENYLKNNITTREDIDSKDAENIEKIIKSRIASHRGIVRLYAAVYEKLGVRYQFILTGDRTENLIDKSFENWNHAQYTLLYFPGTREFLCPTLLQMRYPWIDPDWGNENAVFCKSTTIGTFTTAMAEIRWLPLKDYTQSYINMETSFTLNSTNDTLLIDMRQLWGGYAAGGYRAGYTLSNPDDQRKMLKEMVKYGTNSENIVSSEVKNADFESYNDNKPFILHAVVKSGQLVESAGNKILVKVGEMIGPQTEMYQEKPRQFPVDLPYPHVLERKLDFTIPEGWSVKNLNDLTITHVVTENGDTTTCFLSSFRQEGPVVHIFVREQYRRTSYPLPAYEDFKRVINASADFNKIILVLERKKA